MVGLKREELGGSNELLGAMGWVGLGGWVGGWVGGLNTLKMRSLSPVVHMPRRRERMTEKKPSTFTASPCMISCFGEGGWVAEFDVLCILDG